jgi:hypothetical protein
VRYDKNKLQQHTTRVRGVQADLDDVFEDKQGKMLGMKKASGGEDTGGYQK